MEAMKYSRVIGNVNINNGIIYSRLVSVPGVARALRRGKGVHLGRFSNSPLDSDFSFTLVQDQFNSVLKVGKGKFVCF